MNRALHCLVCCTLVLAGVQSHAQSLRTIDFGEARQFELAGSEPHRFLLDSDSAVQIAVSNVSRGTYLTVYDEKGERLLRAATWRGGPEGVYYATFSSHGALTLEITPDQEIAPAGEYRIHLDTVDENNPQFVGETAMTEAADLHMQYYVGEGDRRQAALEQYLTAANEFESIGLINRRADALFEAGVVSDELGLTSDALRWFEAAAAIWSAAGDQRGVAATENHRGLIYWTLGDTNQAVSLLESAAAIRTELGDTFFYAQSTDNIGLLHRDLGDAPIAIAYSEHALGIWQTSTDMMALSPDSVDFRNMADPPWLLQSLYALNNLGWAYESLDDLTAAEAYYSQALELSAFLERGESAAELQNNLGRISYLASDLETAMTYFQDALQYFTDVERDEGWAASVHHNLALVFRAAGDVSRAQLELEEALRLRTEERDPIGRAQTLRVLAELDLARNDVDGTIDRIGRALALMGAGKVNRTTQADIHMLAGRAYLANGQPKLAEFHLNLAFDLHRATESPRGETDARMYRALAYQAQGRGRAAVVQLEAALASSRKNDYWLGQFRVLTTLGRVLLELDQLDPAITHASEALAISEEVRSNLHDPVLLRDFASVQREVYDILVSAQLKLGMTASAWHTADAARARRFSDMVGQPRFDASLLAPGEQDRYRELIQRRDELARQNSVYEIDREFPETTAIIRERAAVIDEIYRLQSSARGARNGPRAEVSLANFQALLSDDELVLEYFVSESHAGVWEITNESVSFREAPDFIHNAADLHTGIATIRQIHGADIPAITALSRTLLGESGGALAEAAHVIVVPDGPVHYVPFSALLDPDTGFQQPLIVAREISYLPSAAALVEISTREQKSGEGIAILADPVFDRNDRRVRLDSQEDQSVQLAALDPLLIRAASGEQHETFPRLLGTRDEADAISDAAKEVSVLKFLDTDASRGRVVSGQLDGYRIIHFATHGILDVNEPALSGLVLSGTSPEGIPTADFLRSQDVVALDLAADLVVLSGCDTGLGQAVHGEGLVGLSRAFFFAGADQVVSSLWQVSDQATAELMAHFYAEMLHEDKSPSAALRSAQLKIRETTKWRNPYFWAAFILQGNWR